MESAQSSSYLEDLKEDVRPDAGTDVVLHHAMVHVSPIRLVDQLARGGVLLVVGQVIVHHHYDVVVRDPVGVDNLIGVADISLVAIIEPAITASHQEHPEISVLLRRKCLTFLHSDLMSPHLGGLGQILD